MSAIDDLRGLASELPPGLYESLVTRHLAEVIDLLGDRVRLDELSPPDAPRVLAQHVARAVERALRAPGLEHAPSRQLDLCNRLLHLLEAAARDAVTLQDDVARSQLLLAVLPEQSRGLGQAVEPPRPLTPLTQDTLLINAPREPSLASELRREIASADRIDLLCAFIVWSGVRVLLDELSKARDRGVPVRVITTTYTGTTDQRSLDELSRLGAQIRVSYDTRSTRLHAKAWLFERNSGFSTGFVGSSNLTHSAIQEGREWNVRLTEANSPLLLRRFRAAFETYWADQHFEPYDPERFGRALQDSRQTSTELVPFEIRPWPFQEEMLRRLEVERERHGRWRNLLVAATGTGKTVVSAFDCRRLMQAGTVKTLLFVAHRREILQQSLSVYRNVLRDGSFGELMVEGEQPIDGRHVFASIQSLSRKDLTRFPPDFYDLVVVDEFHHSWAPTYQKVLEYLQPRILLGLTATPERTNPAEDVTKWFDGRIAVELRLWDALSQDLLCPFQYFGVSDGVDLSTLNWRRGGYEVNELSRLYTGNDVRLQKVLEAVRRFVREPLSMRALGFCVSVAHAEYMAERFNRAGIPSQAVHGASPSEVRADALRRLRAGTLNVIFAVDLFNEGLDVPEIDTILLLRPTESATVYLQQLGRGLRKVEGKQSLTVLDFVGQQHRQFRFEPRFSALTGLRGDELRRNVEAGFPYLPAGCSIQLDRVSERVVLDNLRRSLSAGRQLLVSDLRRLGRVTLREFLEQTPATLEDVYRKDGDCWTGLQRQAGFAVQEGPRERTLERAIGRMRHLDDRERLHFYSAALSAEAPPAAAGLSVRQKRLLHMLHLDLWDRTRDFPTLEASLDAIWRHAAVRRELVELLELLREESDSLEQPIGLSDEIPLYAHARYTRNEVLAALGRATPDRPPRSQEGVVWVPEYGLDVFFVTIEKTLAGFSPSTMYRDHATSPIHFHWESQSTTSEGSPTGQRYIHHAERGTRVLLFARESRRKDGRTMPFLCLGPATYQHHRGERPMAITWRLDLPMPPWFFQQARSVA